MTPKVIRSKKKRIQKTKIKTKLEDLGRMLRMPLIRMAKKMQKKMTSLLRKKEKRKKKMSKRKRKKKLKEMIRK